MCVCVRENQKTDGEKNFKSRVKMLRFLGKTTASEARSGGSIATEVCGGEEGLSTWELVNAAHSDDEDLYSYHSDEAVSTGDDLEPIPDEEDDDDDDDDVDVDEDAPAPPGLLSPGDIIAIQAMSISPPMTFPVEMAREYVAHDYAQEYYVDDDVKGVDDGDDDEDVDDDYDLDDELVPWKLKGRFGKQRIVKMGIRKMGQRGGPKLTAKKLPYYDNRPGLSGKLR